MKCELCLKTVDEIMNCKICDTRFCKDCGDYERVLCNDCISYDEALEDDVSDLSD